MLDQMSELGIAHAVVSVSAPATLPLDRRTAVAVARRCNDDIAALRDGAPGRIGGFATLRCRTSTRVSLSSRAPSTSCGSTVRPC